MSERGTDRPGAWCYGSGLEPQQRIDVGTLVFNREMEAYGLTMTDTGIVGGVGEGEEVSE